MNLKDAYRRVGFMCKHFMTRKRSNLPKDLFSLEMAYTEKDGVATVIQMKDLRHIQQVITDETIMKEYYSDAIDGNKRYLGLMQLGIEYLTMVACFDDLPEAQQIMDDKVREEIKETLDTQLPSQKKRGAKPT